ncbi:hypothetical protein NDU88_006649 [Pleurodeles waltl]|uniref:Uncharacterized protein n=1 Tax=Pleurodeles waltl TaxID=8319 RepID=A0AAV7RM17_PLEWA|nr:hypothetical protein NDU88_006649 [Pleurodeles waltl]
MVLCPTINRVVQPTPPHSTMPFSGCVPLLHCSSSWPAPRSHPQSTCGSRARHRGVPPPGRTRAGEGSRAAGAHTLNTAEPISSPSPQPHRYSIPLSPPRGHGPAASLFTFLPLLRAYSVPAWPDQAETASEVGIRSPGSLSRPQSCDRLLVVSPLPILSDFYLVAGPVGSSSIKRPPS